MITSCNHSSAVLCGSCQVENQKQEYVSDLIARITASDAKIAELELKVAELEGLAEYQCADCQDTGWLENRVEGKYPCTCMTEMEPYQLLESRIAELQSDARIMVVCMLMLLKVAFVGSVR